MAEPLHPTHVNYPCLEIEAMTEQTLTYHFLHYGHYHTYRLVFDSMWHVYRVSAGKEYLIGLEVSLERAIHIAQNDVLDIEE